MFFRVAFRVMLSFSREKVALDESGTTKQNQFVQKNHVVNDNRSTLFNDINDHNDAGTMMATPKTGGRRTSRKLKRENQLGATPKGKPSETAPNNNEINKAKTIKESKPVREIRGELAVLTQKSEVNIPEIVRKLQQAANAKKLHENFLKY